MIHIMYGLPASGKTTLAMKMFEELCKKVDINSYQPEKIVYMNVDKQDYKYISNKTDYGAHQHNIDTLIIDGFFTSTENLIRVLKDKLLYIRGFIYSNEITIHVFEQDKQKCLNNDMKRNRENKCSHSIQTGIDEFDIDTFKRLFYKDRMYDLSKTNVVIKKEKVIDYSDKDDFTIYSPWLVGDDITDEFKELDDYLELNYPTITFLQYRKVCKFIKVEEDFTCDYYDTQDTRSVRRSIKLSDVLGCLK